MFHGCNKVPYKRIFIFDTCTIKTTSNTCPFVDLQALHMLIQFINIHYKFSLLVL